MQEILTDYVLGISTFGRNMKPPSSDSNLNVETIFV
jgi:hypothetical protein